MKPSRLTFHGWVLQPIEVAEAAGVVADDGKDGGVVAHVKKYAGGQRSGAGPHQGEHRSYDEHQQHSSPGEAELRAVYEHEGRAGQNDTGGDAEMSPVLRGCNKKSSDLFK